MFHSRSGHRVCFYRNEAELVEKLAFSLSKSEWKLVNLVGCRNTKSAVKKIPLVHIYLQISAFKLHKGEQYVFQVTIGTNKILGRDLAEKHFSLSADEID